MDFKKATDVLFAGITHEHLAEVMGVSVATIRQARLAASAKARRAPPKGWENAVIRLAEGRLKDFSKLVRRLRAGA